MKKGEIERQHVGLKASLYQRVEAGVWKSIKVIRCKSVDKFDEFKSKYEGLGYKISWFVYYK